jgi:adenosylcobyric acid synthase
MLSRSITDHVESRAGRVDGLGLLPSQVSFAAEKTLGRPKGRALGEEVCGYEIHHGVVSVQAGETFLDGCRDGAVYGTTWHGVFENDGFRRAYLREVAAHAHRDFVVAPSTSFAALREARLDALGDLVADHVDTGALLRLIESGPSRDLPALRATLG